MIGNAIRLPGLAAPAPVPAATPADAPLPRTDAHPFAEMLRQNRLGDAAPALAPPSLPASQAGNRPEVGAAADDARAEPAPVDPAASQRDSTRARSRSAGATRAPARSGPGTARSSDSAAAGPAKGKDGDALPARPDSAGAASASPGAPAVLPTDARPRVDADGGVASFGGSLPANGHGDPRPGGDARNDAPSSLPGPLGAPGPAVASATATDARSAAFDREAAGAAPHGIAPPTGADNAAATASFAEALAESKPRPSATPAPADGASPLAAGALASLARPGPGLAPTADPALATTSGPVPVDSPEFAAAFGLQVSTLARDGVQHAELHLNPAEMGPVSIQISLDGTQARVDFGADAAATRHAIEAGLPELASALRDAGFTLAGGGVAQHSRSNGGAAGDADARESDSRRAPAARVASLDAGAQRVARRIAAGGVDLYA
ncbi:MAG: flagellar hook-length control protein FliK [Caldimonas sp.]